MNQHYLKLHFNVKIKQIKTQFARDLRQMYFKFQIGQVLMNSKNSQNSKYTSKMRELQLSKYEGKKDLSLQPDSKHHNNK